MMTEYESLVLLRAREEQLQRNAERFRVISERQAESLAEPGDGAPRAAVSRIALAFTAIFSRRQQEAEPACR